MSRLQNDFMLSDVRVLPTLLAAARPDETRREPMVPPFTKAELRQMILEIMG